MKTQIHLRIARAIGSLQRSVNQPETREKAAEICTFAVALPLHNRAHKYFNRPNVSKRHLALKWRYRVSLFTFNQRGRANLASSLIQTQMMPEFFLAHSTWRINFVAENEEGDLGELLNGEEGIKLRFRFAEAFKVGTIDQKNDTVDFGEIVTPETAG